MWNLMRWITSGVAVLVLVPPSLQSQVTAKTADPVPGTPRAATEVVSPMQLDIPLGAGLARSIQPFPVHWLDQGAADFICDKARVVTLYVKKDTAGKKNYKVTVRARALTDWYRQDIDFTLSLLAGEKILATKKWKSYTLGPEHPAPFSGTPLNAKITLKTDREEFDELFESETPPSVRIVMNVLDYDSNESSATQIADPNDPCPVELEFEAPIENRAKNLSTRLEGVACSRFPFLTYSEARLKWSKNSVTLRVGWKNSFSKDLSVIVEALFVREDGTTFGGAVEPKNADEGKSRLISYKFKAVTAEAVSVRFKIYTARD